MSRVKVVIVEDEKIAARNLEKLILRIDPEIQILAELASVHKATLWFSENKADLIFMDIQLADGLSFKIFENVTINVPVIFTTAYDQYAIKAFKTNGIDYLLKPIDANELETALRKFRNFSLVRSDYYSLREILGHIREVPEYKQRFMIQTGRSIRSIPTDEIAYFYFTEKTVYLCTHDGRHFPLEYSLDKLEELLDPDIFFRINRRILVSIESINKIYSMSKSRIKLELKPEFEDDVLVSFNKTPAFRSWLNK